LGYRPDSIPSRETDRIATEERESREEAVEREAIAFLKEARQLDQLVDEHLARLDETEQGASRRRAHEEASRIRDFSKWSEAAQTRQVDYLVRKLALADASSSK
jgi:hypothetical protein